MATKESGEKDGKSVLEDKQEFDENGMAKDKVAHMGDKPGSSEQARPGGETQKPEK
jgi:hypothetical protein